VLGVLGVGLRVANLGSRPEERFVGAIVVFGRASSGVECVIGIWVGYLSSCG
jgi:hypothetical protein